MKERKFVKFFALTKGEAARKRLLSLLLVAVMLFANVQCVLANNETTPQIKNIIYMIPDGGGMASFYLADYVKHAGGWDMEMFPNATPVEKGEMYLKQYLVASETTHSASDAVTDSAASGTALSSGYKTNNGYIGITPNYIPRASILDLCQDMGKNTGLVATYEWTNATPAAFSAHVSSRYDTLEIGEQVVNQGIDVVLARTITDYLNQPWFTDESFENRGYEVLRTKDQLDSVEPGDRVWSKIVASYYDIEKSEEAPHLAELTATAIRALDDGNENGFFLMVEGSAVDGGGHDSNARNMVSEWLAFDEACRVAIEYAKKRTDTIVVVMPDHDTGGMRYGSKYTRSSLEALVPEIREGRNPSSITWEGNGGHTGRNGGIFMYVPEGVPYPSGIDVSKAPQVAAEFEADFRYSSANRIDNTVMAPYLASLIGGDLDEMTEELLVDVTNMGTFGEDGKTFTFENNEGAEEVVTKNSSSALVGGVGYNLDGQLVVFSGGKVFAPRILLTAKPKTHDISVRVDYNTKKVSISGKTGDASATVTVIATDPNAHYSDEDLMGSQIAHIAQLKSSYHGNYELDFEIQDAQVGDYNYSTKIAYTNNIEDYNFSFKNMSLNKDDVAVEDMSELKEGDKIELVLSGYDSNYEGNAFICQYDKDGTLITVDTLPLKGEAVQGTTLDEAIETKFSATVAEGTERIKALYWSYGFVPFTGAYVVE